MSVTTQNPSPILFDLPEFEGYDEFPNALFLISAGDGKYAANNATLPDGQVISGLASFPNADEATTYMGLLAGLNGEIVSKSFQEAREIAKSKPVLSAVFLFVSGKIVDIHYVR